MDVIDKKDVIRARGQAVECAVQYANLYTIEIPRLYFSQVALDHLKRMRLKIDIRQS